MLTYTYIQEHNLFEEEELKKEKESTSYQMVKK